MTSSPVKEPPDQGRLLLHWSPRSPFVRKVMIAAHEAGMQERLHLIRTVVSMSAPNADLMRDNPLSKLPTLVIQGRDGRQEVLFDSGVICEWFDTAYRPGALFPADAGERLLARKMEAVGNGILESLLLWLEERLRPEPMRSSLHLQAFETKICSALSFLEEGIAVLTQRPFDIGHLTIGCALAYADFRFAFLDWRSSHACLAQWHDGFCSRPSVVASPVTDDLDEAIGSRLKIASS